MAPVNRHALWLLIAACAVEPPLPSWEIIDVDSVEARLDAPTARRQDVRRQLSDVDDAVRAAQRSGDAASLLRPVLAEGEVADLPRGDAESIGTYAFVRIGCPGPDAEDLSPNPSFDAGELRVDAPIDLDLTARAVALAGDLLLSFEACGLGDGVLDGAMSAWWDARVQRLSLDGELLRTTDAGPRPVAIAGQLEEGASRWVVPVGASRRATLHVDDAGTVRLILADGEVSCTSDGRLDCDLDALLPTLPTFPR